MEDERVLAFIQSAVDLAEERLGKRLGETEERFGKRLEQRLGETEKRLGSQLTSEVQVLRADMARMEQRLIENIQGRREDIDAAFKDIRSLRRAVRDLDKRVTTLEARCGR